MQGCREPLNGVGEFVQSWAPGLSHVVEECVKGVEQARTRIVVASYANCPRPLAILIEKVSVAIPEAFAALASLMGGIIALPALLVSWGRKMVPLMPLLQNVFRGKLSEEDLGDGCKKMLDGFDEMFEKALVPGMFVALTVDTVFSFAIGWFVGDLGRMLHATAVALPGALLAARHMLNDARPGFSLREPIPGAFPES